MHLAAQRARSAPRLSIAIVAGALSASYACADPSNRADVFEEAFPEDRVPEGRTHAFRVTLFEYSNEVGGFIEFFEIDGVQNTATNPFFASSACDYFGAGRLQNDEFPISVQGPDGPMVLSADRINDGNRIVVGVVEPGGAGLESGSELEFVRTDEVAARSCGPSPYPE